MATRLREEEVMPKPKPTCGPSKDRKVVRNKAESRGTVAEEMEITYSNENKIKFLPYQVNVFVYYFAL